MSKPLTAAIGGATRAAAVVGHPVRHSLSPRIHNAAFEATGMDWVYLALDVAPDRGGQIVDAMRTLDLAGLSVTMPHKAAVAVAADERTVAVERLGAANCLYWRDGRIIADSTDGDGLVAAYQHQFDRPVNGQTVAVFGAGGAGKSIIEALGRHDAAAIAVFNRSPGPLEAAVNLAEQARPGQQVDIVEADILINASSVGMNGGPAPGEAPFDVSLIHGDHTVIDVVYNPAETPLLKAARAVSAQTQGGVPMLVHQAALAFELWTGESAPIEAMIAAVAEHLG